MKKTKVVLLAGLVFSMPLLQQCMGSFALTNKVYDFNKTVGSKFVNELVFFAFLVVPVYSVTLFIDGIILNSVEFWTGANPMAMNDGEVKKERFVTAKGEVDVTVSKNTISFATIENGVTGENITFTFAQDETTWYMTSAEGTRKFLQFDMSGAEPKSILFTEEGRGVAFDMGTRNSESVLSALNAARLASAN